MPHTLVQLWLRVLTGMLCAVVLACGGKSSSQPRHPQQPYPQGYQQPPQPGAQPPQPGAQPPATQPPAAPPVSGQPGSTPPSAQGSVTADPLSTLNLAFLRQRAQQILNELVAALPAAKQQRVAGIPLVIDNTVGEVNAFAACSKTGQSAMAITEGLLSIQALMAQAQAHDELYGTNKVDEYISIAARNLKPGQPIPMPPAGFFPGSTNAQVVTRQHQVFEEQVAFVLGHELGHHHLGHLPCTARHDPLRAGEAARILSSAVPLFNQPNEVAADLVGTTNLLDAGRARATRGQYAWTEAGGLLTMRFFAGFGRLSPASILTAFERSHPPPELRTPIIQQAANTWRATGGARLPIPGF